VLLALLIYAYSHGVRSSRVIERLCGRDAGYRFMVGDAVPDHTVIARFRQRHVARMREVFLAVLRLSAAWQKPQNEPRKACRKPHNAVLSPFLPLLTRPRPRQSRKRLWSGKPKANR